VVNLNVIVFQAETTAGKLSHVQDVQIVQPLRSVQAVSR
jgi:hypothetical protein